MTCFQILKFDGYITIKVIELYCIAYELHLSKASTAHLEVQWLKTRGVVSVYTSYLVLVKKTNNDELLTLLYRKKNSP